MMDLPTVTIEGRAFKHGDLISVPYAGSMGTYLVTYAEEGRAVPLRDTNYVSGKFVNGDIANAVVLGNLCKMLEGLQDVLPKAK